MSASIGKNATGILDIPPEVVTYIFSFCESKDIQSAALSCKFLCECSSSDDLWRLKSSREFDVTNVNRDNWTYRYLYWHLLYKYGYTIGIWRSADVEDSCGVVLKTEFDADACSIKGYEICTPQSPHTSRPVRRKLLFDIRADREPGRKVRCCYMVADGHHGCIHKTDDGFKFECEYDEVAHEHIHSPGYIQQWVEENFDSTAVEATRWSRDSFSEDCIASFRHEFKLCLQPLVWPGTVDNAIIQPGMFKGTYDVHGLELVMLSYEDENRITVNKVTGDNDVPAGQLTFMVDLSRPINLSRLQQTELAGLDLHDKEVEDLDNRLRIIERQDFVLPEDWTHGVSLPQFCLARFIGKGQIAGSGFTEPELTDGHWVLFDENTFGFLWLELEFFNIFSRVLGKEIAGKKENTVVTN